MSFTRVRTLVILCLFQHSWKLFSFQGIPFFVSFSTRDSYHVSFVQTIGSLCLSFPRNSLWSEGTLCEPDLGRPPSLPLLCDEDSGHFPMFSREKVIVTGYVSINEIYLVEIVLLNVRAVVSEYKLTGRSPYVTVRPLTKNRSESVRVSGMDLGPLREWGYWQ